MSQRPDWLHRAEWSAAVAVCVFLSVVHIAYFSNVGPLWRDEVNTANVAGMPTWRDFWWALEFESYPPLWPLLLRAWGASLGDSHLRVLSLAIGLSIAPVVCWTTWRCAHAVPVTALTLFAANPTMLWWGDSVRAYGLGAILMVLTLGQVWLLVERPSARRVAMAAILSVLAVQTLYYNSILLLALCIAGSSVSLCRRNGQVVAMLAGIGALSALSLLPNWGHITGARVWGTLAQSPISAEALLHKFHAAVVPSGRFALFAWGIFFAGTLCICVLRTLRGAAIAGDRDRAVFFGTATAVGTVSYVTFLLILSYETQPWYYISIMAFLAPAFDVALHLFVGARARRRVYRLAMFLTLAGLIGFQVWPAARFRHTNVDIVANALTATAARKDFIVVTAWEVGLTFHRYYRGATPWTTLPPIADHRVHRYDLVKKQISQPDEFKPLLDQIRLTLASGQRVWLVGALEFRTPGQGPGTSWSSQTAFFLQTGARELKRIPLPAPSPVNPYEDVPLFVVGGWRTLP